jgi:hypothetical protein
VRGLPSKKNRQPSDLLLSGDLVRVQELLWVSFHSKGASQRRPDLYMKTRDYDFALGALGAWRIWAYRDIDVYHRSLGIFQDIPRTSLIGLNHRSRRGHWCWMYTSHYIYT